MKYVPADFFWMPVLTGGRRSGNAVWMATTAPLWAESLRKCAKAPAGKVAV